jgi:hypothetical protein
MWWEGLDNGGTAILYPCQLRGEVELTVIASLCPLIPVNHFTLSPSSLTSHTPTSLSLPPLTINLPSSLAATQKSSPWCPVGGAIYLGFGGVELWPNGLPICCSDGRANRIIMPRLVATMIDVGVIATEVGTWLLSLMSFVTVVIGRGAKNVCIRPSVSDFEVSRNFYEEDQVDIPHLSVNGQQSNLDQSQPHHNPDHL